MPVILATWRQRSGGSWLKASLDKKFARPHLNHGWGQWCTPVITAVWGSLIRRITEVQAGPGIKSDPKITTTKKAGFMAQVVERLPSKHKALGSNFQYYKINK
jgi:hypothetical protein